MMNPQYFQCQKTVLCPCKLTPYTGRGLYHIYRIIQIMFINKDLPLKHSQFENCFIFMKGSKQISGSHVFDSITVVSSTFVDHYKTNVTDDDWYVPLIVITIIFSCPRIGLYYMRFIIEFGMHWQYWDDTFDAGIMISFRIIM